MKSYRDLDVYVLSHSLAVKIHGESMRLPKYELYESGSQIRRASKSISANIVEGYGRRQYKADYVRFLVIAHASCDETHEWVEYILDCHPDHAEAWKPLLSEVEELGRKLYRFIQAVEAGHKV